jgi:hypothetical protein
MELINLCVVPGTAFVCNAYHIGKERCYFKAALACDFSVWASPSRTETFKRLSLPQQWLGCLVEDIHAADVIVSDHGVGPPSLAHLQKLLERRVVGFQCTGATASPSKDRFSLVPGFTKHYYLDSSLSGRWNDANSLVLHSCDSCDVMN